MYLKKSYNRKTGRTQLFIVEAYRDKDKKPKAKVIKTLGYLDVLEKKYEDPIGYFSRLTKQMTVERDKAIKTIQLVINPGERVLGPAPKLNFGCAALLNSYADLGLDRFFSSLPQMTKIEYNLNIIFRNVICLGVINPSIKKGSSATTNLLFGDFESSVSDYHRAADLASKHRDSLVSFITQRLISDGAVDPVRRKQLEAEFNSFVDELFDMPKSSEELFRYLRELFYNEFRLDHELLDRLSRDFEPTQANYTSLYDSAMLIRYVGFALCCVLRKKLGDEFSIIEIVTSLRKCEYVYVNDDIYMLEYCDELLEKLGRTIGVDFTMKFRTIDDIKALIRA